MDQPIKRKRITLKRGILVLGTLSLLLVSWLVLSSNSEKSLRVEASKLTIDPVMYSDYQEVVAINGMLEPVKTIQITAIEGGRVEEVFVEDGAEVALNQPIVRLSNASMQLDFMNRETQIIEQINNLRSTRITLDQNKRQVQEQLLEVEYLLKERKRQYSIDSTLYAEGAIAKSDYDESYNQLLFLNQRADLLRERKSTDEAYRQSQLQRIDNSIELMERNLRALRKTIDNLTIKAPMSGHISQFDHDIGESKARGETIGRVDVLDSFIVAAPVDQYYLNRVELGQLAIADIGGRSYPAKVSKIFPSVENGQFNIHLEFTDIDGYDNMRRGQNIRVKLELSAREKALLLKRGGFYHSSSGKFVYVLEDEDTARKREIKIGSQNPSYFQILDGLSEGEKVITSSYQSFGDAEVIKLTN